MDDRSNATDLQPVTIIDVSKEGAGTHASALSLVHEGPPALAEELVRNPPVWARELIDRRASTRDLVLAAGRAALTARTREERQVVLRTLGLLAFTAGVRDQISYTLGDAVLWALEDDALDFLFLAPITVYDNADISAGGPAAWLSLWEDEAVYPEAVLQTLQLDQAISAVSFDPNTPNFAELCLFDGPDLQGSFVRIAQERSATKPPHVVLTPATLNDQARSLLGSVHLVPGRRFSATTLFTASATAAFLTGPSGLPAGFGTISLLGPPRFSWDGYEGWREHGPSLFNRKCAALRVEFDFHLEDALHGPVDGTGIIDVTPVLRSPVPDGVAPHVLSIITRQEITLPQPWAGGFFTGHPSTWRWKHFLGRRLGDVVSAIAQGVDSLASAPPQTLRILPGRSLQPGYSVVFPPAGPRSPLVEAGHTTDDATIVLNP